MAHGEHRRPTGDAHHVATSKSSFASMRCSSTDVKASDAEGCANFERDLLDRIDALGAPKGDEDKVNAILDAGHQALARLKTHPLLIRAQPGSAKDPFRDLGRLAAAYGLRCGG